MITQTKIKNNNILKHNQKKHWIFVSILQWQ